MSPTSPAQTTRRRKPRPGAQLVRRVGATILRRNRRIDALIVERQNLRTAKGILALEKGGLEAAAREAANRIVNPPAPQPPTNPAGHVPPTVPQTGQAYRAYLTRQITASPPAIPGLRDRGEFLRLTIGRQDAGELGGGWTTIDLADPPPSVSFPSNAPSLPAEWASRFALAVCNAVLEHVPYPQRAVDELHRVLEPGGYLYVEVGCWQPYRIGCATGDEHGVGGDYWRATVEGLRRWAAAFDEISRGWADEGVVYFFGRKPAS